MIAIIDYDAGNIRSVENALIALGEEVVITRDPEILLQAEKVILPGVGAFGDAMEKLHAYGLVDVIHQIVKKKTPFLGICLGLQLLFDEAVKDAMIIDKDEILPVVSLDEGEPYAVYDDEGRILLYTFHKYPDSYPDGADVKLEWGNVWTFTGGELEEKYQENKDSVTDWQTRLKELIGLRPDNESNYFTAMWVKPEDVFRPAYVSDIGTVEMTDSFSEDVNEEYKAWFDDNIISSYFDGAYPWTRLGYTYDWADNGQEYGLSEFIVKKDSNIKVAYTVELDEMLKKLENDSWNPQAENSKNS